jgi:DNA-binding transcriptional MerR regulator
MLDTVSIGDVVKMTGITEKQLRFWEERGYITKPQRLVCGESAYRRYTKDQVRSVSRIKEFLDQGYTLHKALEFAAKYQDGGKSNDT